MYKIIVTEPAQKDINDALSYITYELKNKQAAITLLDEIEKTVDSLTEMPSRQPLLKDDYLKKEGFRVIKINNYLLFYVVRGIPESVVIERFLYAKRDWMNIIY